MSTAVHLAGAEDRARLMPLVLRAAEERGLPMEPSEADRAYGPLLDGTPLGAVWLIGPRAAPLGYVAMGFGWSVARAAPESWLNDIFVRPSVRRRGIGTEVLHAIAVSLSRGGVRALNVRLPAADAGLQAFCARAGFGHRDAEIVMSDPP